MELMRCENMMAEISSRTCLLNQARDEMEGGRFHCSECEVGRVIRETNGGGLPKLIKVMGKYQVVTEDGAMAQLVKIDGEKVFTRNGKPLEVSAAADSARIASSISQPEPCIKCGDNPKHKKTAYCLDCLSDRARENAKIRKEANQKKRQDELTPATKNEVEKISPSPMERHYLSDEICKIILNKYPMFDPTWPEAVQVSWLEYFGKLIDLMR